MPGEFLLVDLSGSEHILYLIHLVNNTDTRFINLCVQIRSNSASNRCVREQPTIRTDVFTAAAPCTSPIIGTKLVRGGFGKEINAGGVHFFTYCFLFDRS